jgi:diacylglycerol kinase
MKKFVAGFQYAFNGISLYLRSGRNVNVHIAATLVVIIAALWLQLSAVKCVLLVSLITIVHMAEAFNTAIEKLVDKVSPEYHPLAGQVKGSCCRSGAIVSYRFSSRWIDSPPATIDC